MSRRGFIRKPGRRGKNISTEQQYQVAVQHLDKGERHKSELVLRKILCKVPRHPHALHLLGLITHQSGKTERAIAIIKKAIGAAPDEGQFFANICEMYRVSGKLDEAISYGKQAVEISPSSTAAHANLGIAYYDSNNLDAAEACQRRALKIDNRFVTSLNNLGSIERARNNRQSAIGYFEEVLKYTPNHLESINNLGALLTEIWQPEKAVQLLSRALRLQPNYAKAHCNIAKAYMVLEQYEKAITGFTRALELDQEFAEAYMGLANVYQEHDNYPEAEKLAEKAAALAPEKPGVHSLAGDIYRSWEYPEKAAVCYTKALEFDPNHLPANLGLGYLQMQSGDMDLAEKTFEHVLKLDNSNLSAMLSLIDVEKIEKGDKRIEVLEKELEQLDSMAETKAIELHFGLGKCYNDTRKYNKAFPHFLEGCRLKRKRINYEPVGTDGKADTIISTFSAEKVRSLAGGGCPSNVPIFILGMPRSGTTLTEQIIASHPKVYGAGELADLEQVASINGKKYPLSMENITREKLRSIGERYVAGLQERNPQADRITDKMPANFNLIGLIHLILPNARIIHVRRNPVDTCLSAFTILFNKKTQHHSYDLVELGRYYLAYTRIMDHWRRLLPQGSFYELQYEDLVADSENQTRALIEFCGLDWEDACIAPHKTSRSVKTASITQVREPIYTSSVERWRKYEKFLEPLLNVLEDLVPNR
ncbi:tetratricopeptide repeat-containing sulfotransferase family protein [Desulforhopalus singaporensis]|uniref:Tfp pilus assembly protein PilF n=1 Tax=Desulforhopalus singaporensis TaxID=91360 RepID=A0A1H0VK92_9BACT|nr:tetratricopeptide repeat-containing sulfotransferase family protein [Desulforhopalus singaporensis]SDP78638.1 Tfp pilus assembly protein PilF [Desulforhopalus singaporensis]